MCYPNPATGARDTITDKRPSHRWAAYPYASAISRGQCLSGFHLIGL